MSYIILSIIIATVHFIIALVVNDKSPYIIVTQGWLMMAMFMAFLKEKSK